MERFPDDFVLQHLHGPLTYQDANHFEVTYDNEEKSAYRCLQCPSKGQLRSPQSCLEHCRGRKHQRNYGFLVRQQEAWVQDQLVPDSFKSQLVHENEEDVTDDVLDYFMPFRRWHFGKWQVGLSCQLCGTAAFPNRWAIADHCENSRRHILLRNRTLYEDSVGIGEGLCDNTC